MNLDQEAKRLKESAVYSAEEIQSRLRERPFRPLRIIASEGQRFDIHHPDLVFVGRRDLMIGFPVPENPTIYDRVTRIALVHVVALEDLPAPTAPANGPG
jgi:hypothetical protein